MRTHKYVTVKKESWKIRVRLTSISQKVDKWDLEALTAQGKETSGLPAGTRNYMFTGGAGIRLATAHQLIMRNIDINPSGRMKHRAFIR